MMKVTAFHLKELTLQMTMVFAYYRFRLWYKIDRSCGIRQSKNIDFIICDHHRPGEFYPMPLLFLTQNDDCTYPYDELCGCGIGFKLIQALGRNQNQTKI
jgi:hypothetical protein